MQTALKSFPITCVKQDQPVSNPTLHGTSKWLSAAA